MKRSNLLRLGVVLFAATCVDDREKPRSPTEPSVAVVASEASLVVGSSTVCVAYNRELEKATAQLDAALQVGGDAQQQGGGDAQQRVAALTTAISDACR